MKNIKTFLRWQIVKQAKDDIIINEVFMSDYLLGLNQQQYQAVTTKSQYVRVVAGAGSGKTRVLTTRVVYLVENWGISPENILAITFTNKAANEMKKRLEAQLGLDKSKAQVSTIHSFCVRVLRQEIRREGYPSNFTILDGDDQKSIIKEAIKVLDYTEDKDLKIPTILSHISNDKCAGLSPKDILEKSNNYYYEKVAHIYEYYDNRCHELYALDFDDLLLWTNKILEKYPNVRKKWQDKYQFILVDEFQDIDNVQYKLITLLANPNTYIYVVGDPDQTIYSWRGADINIIMQFEKEFKGTETIILNKNYRSTQNILNGANSLISYNKRRVKKDLVTENKEGSKILHCCAASDESESLFVAEKIASLVKKGYKYQDIAILYRSNYLSRSVEKQLIAFGIPYIIYGAVRFYDRAEIKDMLCYLRMMTVKDDLSLKRVINTPKRGIGQKSVDDLFVVARNNRISCFDAIDIYEGSAKTKMLKFKGQVLDWIERSKDQPISKTFEMLFSESGLRNQLENSNDPSDEDRQENVKELLNDITQYEQELPEATLDDYLANVALYSDIQNNTDENHITLMTVHSAKGLEFKNVFVIGMSEGIFPAMKSLEDGINGLEEERRLAYVAYTRAKENLFITDNRAYSYSVASEKQTSRFVKEIDSEYIDEYGSSSQRKATNVDYVSPINLSNEAISSKKSKYKVGDMVYHDILGKGVITKIDGNYGEIAFSYPAGVKKISLTFPKLHKWEDVKDD